MIRSLLTLMGQFLAGLLWMCMVALILLASVMAYAIMAAVVYGGSEHVL